MKNRASVLFVFVALSFVAVSGELANATSVPPSVENANLSPITPDQTTSTTAPSDKVPPTPPTPITTPPPQPTPTPAPPTPVPDPETGMWVYTDKKDNNTCIIIRLATQWNVTYINTDTNLQRTVFNLPVAETFVVNGSCGNDTQFITLQWPVSNTSVAFNDFTIYFEKNVTSKDYAINKMEFSFALNSTNFPNATANNQTTHLEMTKVIFSVPLSRSYRCSHKQAFNLTLPNHQENRGSVIFSNLQEQAFLTEKGHSFGSAMDCDGSDVPDAVPIGVGIALAIAVLLVLIGYLIGRRRNQARGYLSM